MITRRRGRDRPSNDPSEISLRVAQHRLRLPASCLADPFDLEHTNAGKCLGLVKVVVQSDQPSPAGGAAPPVNLQHRRAGEHCGSQLRLGAGPLRNLKHRVTI